MSRTLRFGLVAALLLASVLPAFHLAMTSERFTWRAYAAYTAWVYDSGDGGDRAGTAFQSRPMVTDQVLLMVLGRAVYDALQRGQLTMSPEQADQLHTLLRLLGVTPNDLPASDRAALSRGQLTLGALERAIAMATNHVAGLFNWQADGASLSRISENIIRNLTRPNEQLDEQGNRGGEDILVGVNLSNRQVDGASLSKISEDIIRNLIRSNGQRGEDVLVGVNSSNGQGTDIIVSGQTQISVVILLAAAMVQARGTLPPERASRLTDLMQHPEFGTNAAVANAIAIALQGILNRRF